MLVPSLAFGQLWSGIIDPPRATDWTAAGVSGGIPKRETICSSLTSSASASTINSAIAGCPSGQVVFLAAGTYTLSAGITLNKSNVTLRGAGADKTILNISGNVGQGCHIGDGRVFNICQGSSNIGVDSPDNTAVWSAGYSQGTTNITLNVHTNLTVGSTIWLDQLDDTADGYPAAGDVYICDTAATTCSNQAGAAAYARSGRSLVEGHVVTACGTSTPGAACTSNNVTITPGIINPVFRSGRSPGAWWGNTSNVINNSGVEDLTINMTPCSGCSGLYIINGTNVWVKGVRLIKTDASGSEWRGFFTVNAVRASVVDSYIYGGSSTEIISYYSASTHVTTGLLFQNNILHNCPIGLVPNSTTHGSVFAYNYSDNVRTATVVEHGLTTFNLYEGNDFSNFVSDIIHAPHFFLTLFRNLSDGTLNNPAVANWQDQAPFALHSLARFYNVIGNVSDTGHTTSYQVNEQIGQNTIFELGWRGTGSGVTVNNDPNVERTLYRWGNWDDVTNAVRWCGNSGNTGWSTTCSSTSEVPTGITNYPQSVPSTETLPASFYLGSTRPAWFGSIAYPPIGPDVSGGNISGFGGHANKIPAKACFDLMSQDSTNFSGTNVIHFLPQLCYGTGSGVAPGALPFPENIRTQ